MVTNLLLIVVILLAALVGLALYFIMPPKNKTPQSATLDKDVKPEEDRKEEAAPAAAPAPSAPQAEAAPASGEPAAPAEPAPVLNDTAPDSDDNSEAVGSTKGAQEEKPAVVQNEEQDPADNGTVAEERPLGETIDGNLLSRLREFNTLHEELREQVARAAVNLGLLTQEQADKLLTPSPGEIDMAKSASGEMDRKPMTAPVVSNEAGRQDTNGKEEKKWGDSMV